MDISNDEADVEEMELDWRDVLCRHHEHHLPTDGCADAWHGVAIRHPLPTLGVIEKTPPEAPKKKPWWKFRA
jgi:hypothetical protein